MCNGINSRYAGMRIRSEKQRDATKRAMLHGAQIPTPLPQGTATLSIPKLQLLHSVPTPYHADTTDMDIGEVGDMRELGITESFKLKKQVVVSASEAAEMILRVDNILRAAPRRREAM
jgi:T-complex protein 1 subunit beta